MLNEADDWTTQEELTVHPHSECEGPVLRTDISLGDLVTLMMWNTDLLTTATYYIGGCYYSSCLKNKENCLIAKKMRQDGKIQISIIVPFFQ